MKTAKDTVDICRKHSDFDLALMNIQKPGTNKNHNFEDQIKHLKTFKHQTEKL